MENQASSNKRVLLGVIAISLIIGGLGGQWMATQQIEGYKSAVVQQVSQQQAKLMTMSDLIARNDVDDLTRMVVQDCAVSDRNRFDLLLGQLDAGLPADELIELDQLFDLCASFYSDRKSHMVAQFARELEFYQQQLSLLDEFENGSAFAEANAAIWQSLLKEEQTQSQLFAELVQAQKQIIDRLLTGSAPDSAEITTILEGVVEIKEAQTFARQQATMFREQLKSS